MEININDVNDALKNLTYFGSKATALDAIHEDMRRGLKSAGSTYDEHTVFLVEQGMEQLELARIYITHIDKLLSDSINQHFFQQNLDTAIEDHYEAVAQAASLEEQKLAVLRDLDELIAEMDEEEFDEDEFEEEDDEYMEYDEYDFEDDSEEEWDEGHPEDSSVDLDKILDGIDLDEWDDIMKDLG